MISLIDILREGEYKKKEPGNKNYKGYSVHILIKSKDSINRNNLEDRLRALEGVTIVKDMSTPQLDRINQKSKNFNYDLYQIKFVTHLPPEEKIQILIDQILHSNIENGHHKIVGAVNATPKLDTLEKL